jgi:hypothetical protein
MIALVFTEMRDKQVCIMKVHNEFSATEKFHIASQLTLFWNEHLTSNEFRLLSWLYGNTIVRGRRVGSYSIMQMVRGIPAADQSGMWCFGCGLSKSSVIRAIASLREKGVIQTEPGRRATLFEINQHWTPWADTGND